LCIFCGLIAVLGGACRRQAAGLPPGISNAALGIRLLAMPSGWETVQNDAQGIELRRSVDGGQGRLKITVSAPQSGGVNLVAAVKERQREIEGQGGTFFGSKQLKTPFGPAYTARGSYKTVLGEVEELTVFALHPDRGGRMLTLSYTYPAGSETSARAQELFDVLAEVDRLEVTPPAKG
jgi:hypothetical protein